MNLYRNMNTPYQLTNINPQTLVQLSERKIHKVPPLIRREGRNSGAYDPKAVSFGPYHHGKPELEPFEQVKRLALQTFVQGSNQTSDFFYNKVLDVISDARECYVDGSTDQYDDENFAAMMLLDSCFLIYIVYGCTVTSITSQLPESHLNFLPIYLQLGNLAHVSIAHDILLMENQIPFEILMMLISLRYDDGEETVCKFLQGALWGQFEHQHLQDIKQQLSETPPLHLFEALRMVLLLDKHSQNKFQFPIYTDEKGDIDILKPQMTFRSAKDLKAKGIQFKASGIKSLKAVSFNSFPLYGQLLLPTWFVSSLSKVFFQNMIAYELSPGTIIDTTVISYINFMKSLINSAADVKELRDKRILLTSLSSDEDVVRLYKDLHTYEIVMADNYIEVKQKIQDHYDSRAQTWMAQLYYTYFQSPWSAIGWLAGVFLLVLTFMQTYFTANPPK